VEATVHGHAQGGAAQGPGGANTPDPPNEAEREEYEDYQEEEGTGEREDPRYWNGQASMEDAVNNLTAGLADCLRQNLPSPGGPGSRSGGTQKIFPFESGKGSEWIDWVRTFKYAVQINKWDDERARMSLAANIAGDAASMVRTIDPLDHYTLDSLVQAYQAVFITPADSEMARMDFRTGCQAQNEGLIHFHIRLRNLYTQAYPREEDPDRNIDLIDQFITGLRQQEVAKEVNKAAPSTYAGALEIAQNQTASIVKFSANRRRLARLEPSSELGMMAMGGGGGGAASASGRASASSNSSGSAGASGKGKPGPCFACKSTEHQVADCPSAEYWAKRKGLQGGLRGQGQKRGGGRGGGGSGAGQSRIAAMGTQEKKDKTPDGGGPDSLIMEMLTPNQINFLKESLAQVETAKTTTASGN